jgi:hypothetical protein
MFTDPHSITVSGTPRSMPRVGDLGETGSEYKTADGNTALQVSHDEVKGGRTRSMVRLNIQKITSDPFKPAENVKVTGSVYLVVDTPPAGYTDAEMKAEIDGFIAMLSASSGADITKLLAGEH